MLEKFFKGGYLRFATEEEKLASLKKTELQELLAEHGLKKTGNKDALIRQILQNLPKEKYLPKIGFDVFLLTESGKEIIDKNDHLFFYDDIEIPIEMVDLARQMNPAFNKYQALRFSQGKRIRNLIRKQEYPSIGIALMSIAGTYLKEYEVKKAFSYVMLALYMDMFDDELKLLSCSESYKLLIQEIPEAYPGHFIIAPAKLVEFWSLKEKYDIAEDIVIEYVRQASDFLKMNVDPQKTRERIQELLSSRGEVILESDRPRWEP
ncbi:MAG: SAP domain-containing protein [Peptostreptococcaceae bacterium]|nr:SAP domain-containing protein [Peptostreptococcaceae bacterium]